MKHIYIHIPFCVRKCPYCDFYSIVNREDVQESYVTALLKEFEMQQHYLSDSLATIYFGGGTPSLLKPELMKRIIDKIRDNFAFSKDIEITIEVNPGTVTGSKLEMYKKMGINRISIGAQSFLDDELKVLGRIHKKGDTLNSYQLVREAGFDNVTLDLMVGLPGQNIEKLDKNIDTVIALNPEHISSYILTYYEETEFYRFLKEKKIAKLADDDEIKLFNHLIKRLAEKGYERYELSNFSKKGRESRHNMNTWSFGNYLGLGASAHSHFNEFRWNNIADVNAYIKQMSEQNVYNSYHQETSRLEEQISEYVMLGFRKTAGIDTVLFQAFFKIDFFDKFGKICEKYIKSGHLELKGKNIYLTPKGFDLYNFVVSDFLG